MNYSYTRELLEEVMSKITQATGIEFDTIDSIDEDGGLDYKLGTSRIHLLQNVLRLNIDFGDYKVEALRLASYDTVDDFILGALKVIYSEKCIRAGLKWAISDVPDLRGDLVFIDNYPIDKERLLKDKSLKDFLSRTAKSILTDYSNRVSSSEEVESFQQEIFEATGEKGTIKTSGYDKSLVIRYWGYSIYFSNINEPYGRGNDIRLMSEFMNRAGQILHTKCKNFDDFKKACIKRVKSLNVNSVLASLDRDYTVLLDSIYDKIKDFKEIRIQGRVFLINYTTYKLQKLPDGEICSIPDYIDKEARRMLVNLSMELSDPLTWHRVSPTILDEVVNIADKINVSEDGVHLKSIEFKKYRIVFPYYASEYGQCNQLHLTDRETGDTVLSHLSEFTLNNFLVFCDRKIRESLVPDTPIKQIRPDQVPIDSNSIEVLALKYEDEVVAYRFKLEKGCLDITKDKAKLLGLSGYKIQKSIKLISHNGLLMSKGELDHGVVYPDISDNIELCNKLLRKLLNKDSYTNLSGSKDEVLKQLKLGLLEEIQSRIHDRYGVLADTEHGAELAMKVQDDVVLHRLHNFFDSDVDGETMEQVANIIISSYCRSANGINDLTPLTSRIRKIRDWDWFVDEFNKFIYGK